MSFELFYGDCYDVMSKMVLDNYTVDYILTSPPYNMTTNRTDCYYNNGYSDIDNLTESQYIEKRVNEFKLFDQLLSENGCIIYNISYGSENPALPLLLMTEIINETNFTIVDIISWKKQTAIPFQTSPRRLSRICEQVYILTRKNNTNTFVTNKTISNVNEKTGQKFYKNYTNFIEAENNDKIKCDHKATFSTDLVTKLLSIYVPEEKLVLDPFMGIGTTGVTCKKQIVNLLVLN